MGISGPTKITHILKNSFKKILLFEPTTYWLSVRSHSHYTNTPTVSGRHRKTFKSLHSSLIGSRQFLLIRPIQKKIGKIRLFLRRAKAFYFYQWTLPLCNLFFALWWMIVVAEIFDNGFLQKYSFLAKRKIFHLKIKKHQNVVFLNSKETTLMLLNPHWIFNFLIQEFKRKLNILIHLIRELIKQK